MLYLEISQFKSFVLALPVHAESNVSGIEQQWKLILSRNFISNACKIACENRWTEEVVMYYPCYVLATSKMDLNPLKYYELNC